MALEEVPLRVLKTALGQTTLTQEQVEAALTLVLINEGDPAKEIWWGLARELKNPLLTLSLLPKNICGPANGRASFTQLRKWQLEQVATIIRTVDEVARAGDAVQLSEALQNRVLPWLRELRELTGLWLETAQAGARLGRHETV